MRLYISFLLAFQDLSSVHVITNVCLLVVFADSIETSKGIEAGYSVFLDQQNYPDKSQQFPYVNSEIPPSVTNHPTKRVQLIESSAVS